MGKPKLVVYGAGYTADMFISKYEDNGLCADFDFKGFIDDVKEGSHLGYPIIGKKEDLPNLLKSGIENIVVFLFSNPRKRLETCLELEQMGFNFPSYHNKRISQESTIGKGVYIHDTATLMGSNQNLGDFSLVNAYATVEGGVNVGKGTILAPYVFIGYNSKIGDATFFAPRATCLPGTNVGNNCVIGPHVIVHKKLEDGKKKLK